MTPSPEAPPVPDARVAPPRRRSWKRLMVGAVSLLGLLLLLVIGLVAFRNPILRRVTEYNIRQQTGLDARIASMEIGFRSASVRVAGFTLPNPAGFGDQPLLDLPELYIQLDPAAGQGEKLAFEEIRFHLASLNVVSDANGRLNLEALTRSVRPPRDEEGGGSTPGFGGVRKLSLKVGRMTFTDLAHPEHNFEVRIDLDTEVTGLSTAQDLTNWFGGLITRQALAQILDPSKSRHQRSLWHRLLKTGSTPSKEL